MKQLRRTVCLLLVALVVCLPGAVVLTSGLSFAEGSGGQWPPPTGSGSLGTDWTLLTYAVTTTTILSTM